MMGDKQLEDDVVGEVEDLEFAVPGKACKKLQCCFADQNICECIVAF
jgi:hypothetical protein